MSSYTHCVYLYTDRLLANSPHHHCVYSHMQCAVRSIENTSTSCVCAIFIHRIFPSCLAMPNKIHKFADVHDEHQQITFAGNSNHFQFWSKYRWTRCAAYNWRSMEYKDLMALLLLLRLHAQNNTRVIKHTNWYACKLICTNDFSHVRCHETFKISRRINGTPLSTRIILCVYVSVSHIHCVRVCTTLNNLPCSSGNVQCKLVILLPPTEIFELKCFLDTFYRVDSV